MGIKKTQWVSNFKIIGKAKLNDNSFKIDEVSESGWQYNSFNLGVDCGEDGVIYSSMMGGFSTKRGNVIYVHGKNEDGSDDFQNQFKIDWEDRLDDEITDTIGDFCFVRIGLETTNEGKIFTKKFLSEYDAIAYVKKHLTNDTVINVQGNLRYSFYNDNVTVQREIKSVYLSKAEPENFGATFTQSILVDSDSIDLKNDIDTERGSVFVHARVLDYVKELNGVEIKSQYPLPFTFEYEYNKDTFKVVYDKIFKTKPNTIKQINFIGKFVNSGATITATLDDVPDDIKALIGIVYDEEEILTKYATQGNTERKCILTKPVVKMEGKENPQPVLQIFEERYTEEDFDFNIPTKNPVEDVLIEDEDLSWLDDLA